LVCVGVGVEVCRFCVFFRVFSVTFILPLSRILSARPRDSLGKERDMANPNPAISPVDGGRQLSFPSRSPSSNSTPKFATLTPIAVELPSRPSQRSTPTSARGKHAHNPYGAAVLVPSPIPTGSVAGGQSPEDTGSSVTSDHEQSTSMNSELWPVGPWTCVYRPMLGKLKFVPYPSQAQLSSMIPIEDELLRNLKHQLHQRPDLSHPAKAREASLADEVHKQALELLHRRTEVRIFVGNLWTDLPVGFCQWLLEEMHSQLPPSSESEQDSTPPRAPYLVNASFHQTPSGKFKGCFHATLRCDTDPALILRNLHQRILLDRCGYWLAQNPGEMEMLKDYTTDLQEDQKRLKATGSPTTSWSLPRSPMSWELVENEDFSGGSVLGTELQQMKRTRRCLPLPPFIPCAILPKTESSYDRVLPVREDTLS
jgi:hypothetical protein